MLAAVLSGPCLKSEAEWRRQARRDGFRLEEQISNSQGIISSKVVVVLVATRLSILYALDVYMSQGLFYFAIARMASAAGL